MLGVVVKVSLHSPVFRTLSFMLIIAWIFGFSWARSATVEVEFLSKELVRFTTSQNVAGYFILEASEDIESYEGIGIALGSSPTIWDLDLGEEVADQLYVRVKQASIFSPMDTDGDRIDDIYELNHPLLDPLNPDDALEDPDNNGLTHLQEYLLALFGGDQPAQFYSREISLFQFAGSGTDIVSRELGIFNFGGAGASQDVISREVTVYQGQTLPSGILNQIYSREVSLFNLGSPSAQVEAVSRVLSVYQGEQPPVYAEFPQTYSREISVVQLGSPSSSIEAISRELSIQALPESN